MKKFIILSAVILLFFSCDNQNSNTSSRKKKYQYVEQIRKKSGYNNKVELIEKEPRQITETSDTSAYAAAFMFFCMDYKMYQDLVGEGVNSADEPIGFKLYNSEGKDISNIEFITKADIEKELISEFMSGESIFEGMYSKSSSGMGKWYIKNYVDEFKEETDEKYIAQISFGSFSNSATTNSNLTAVLVIDTDDFRIKLEEYGSLIVKNEGSMNLSVKDKDGEVTAFEMYNDSDGYLNFKYSNNKSTDYERMIQILLKGGTAKFYCVSNRYSSKSTYNFNVHCECLQNALNELHK